MAARGRALGSDAGGRDGSDGAGFAVGRGRGGKPAEGTLRRGWGRDCWLGLDPRRCWGFFVSPVQAGIGGECVRVGVGLSEGRENGAANVVNFIYGLKCSIGRINGWMGMRSYHPWHATISHIYIYIETLFDI